jgi:sugar phosphate isomerase/epimerase
MRYLSLTTWSLNQHLGPLRWTRWNSATKQPETIVEARPENITLLELPKALADKGFKVLEVCHFNFPNWDDTYLNQLKSAFKQAGVTFYNLLIDYGDISSTDEIRRAADIHFIKQWIDVAAQVGAECVRVVAGESAPEDQQAISRSITAFQEIIPYAQQRGVRVLTENFKPLASTAANCLHLLQCCGPQLGFVTDFGNYQLKTKYDELSQTIPFSDSVHAKANYLSQGVIDEEEFRRSLEILKECGYEGPITLVSGHAKDQWQDIEHLKRVVQHY